MWFWFQPNCLCYPHPSNTVILSWKPQMNYRNNIGLIHFSFSQDSKNPADDDSTHYSDVTWGPWRLQPLATRLLVQQHVETAGWQPKKLQSSALLALSEGNQRWTDVSLHRRLVMRKVFVCHDVKMFRSNPKKDIWILTQFLLNMVLIKSTPHTKNSSPFNWYGLPLIQHG